MQLKQVTDAGLGVEPQGCWAILRQKIAILSSDGVIETGLGSRDCLETHFWKSRLGLASDLNFKSRSRVLVSKSHGLEM